MEWKSSAYHVAVAGVLQYTVSNTTFLFARKSGKGAFDQIFTQAYAPRFLERHYARGRRSRRLPRISGRRAASLNVYYGELAAHLLILSIEAACMVSGDRVRPHVFSYREQQNPRQWFKSSCSTTRRGIGITTYSNKSAYSTRNCSQG